jgi:CRISPR-associated protein Cmr4
MITATKMLYLSVETPLHVGTGAGLSSIDLPIQRERTTQYPMIQGSGIKGKLRSIAKDMTEEPNTKLTKDDIFAIFGPEDGSEHAGALIVGDARTLLFPLRSLSGVFAYVTSAAVLHRFIRDSERENQTASIDWTIPQPQTPGNAFVTQISDVCVPDNEGPTTVLEEFTFAAEHSPEVSKIADEIARQAFPEKGYDYWRQKLTKSLVILPEDDFRDFILYATEVITRVKINRISKTVEDGMLWTEEHLPTDTLLYAPTYATNSRRNGHILSGQDILAKAQEIGAKRGRYLQLGGDETVGRGMVRIHWGK